MDILNRFIASTKGDHNEDRLSIRHDLHGRIDGIAIIDGATTDGTRLYKGHTGGWWAAQLAEDAFLSIFPETDFTDFLKLVRQDYSDFITETGCNLALYASFAAVVKRPHGSELWRVGDVMMGYHGGDRHDYFHTITPTLKQVDQLTAEIRRMTITNMMGAGITDPTRLTLAGRQALEDLLTSQLLSANLEGPNLPYAFGVLCAEREVPKRFQQIKLLDPGTTVVLASDGFPELEMDIPAMQRHLDELRENDPHLIGLTNPAYASTKGFFKADGTLQELYDDTTAVVVKL